METGDVKTPPLKPHTTRITTKSATTAKPQRTHLPSVHSSPSPSTKTLHRSPPRSGVNSGRPEASSKLDKRGVRKNDEAPGAHKGQNSQRRERISKASQAWTRYTKTVSPKFTLHEPRSAYDWRVTGKKIVETEEDGRCYLKLSFPCTRECNFCVYSRQLGPVRIYFSSTRTPNTNLVKPSKPVKQEPHRPAGVVDLTDALHLPERSVHSSQEILVPQETVTPPNGKLHRRYLSRSVTFGDYPGTDNSHGFPPGRNLRAPAFGSTAERFSGSWLSDAPFELSISNVSGNTRGANLNVRNSSPLQRNSTQLHGKSLSSLLPVAWGERNEYDSHARHGVVDSRWLHNRHSDIRSGLVKSDMCPGIRYMFVPTRLCMKKHTLPHHVPVS